MLNPQFCCGIIPYSYILLLCGKNVKYIPHFFRIHTAMNEISADKPDIGTSAKLFQLPVRLLVYRKQQLNTGRNGLFQIRKIKADNSVSFVPFAELSQLITDRCVCRCVFMHSFMVETSLVNSFSEAINPHITVTLSSFTDIFPLI